MLVIVANAGEEGALHPMSKLACADIVESPPGYNALCHPDLHRG
jgi:hypothetical protein